MSKGYNNYMSKKNFHPGSQSNQNRIREAEERVEAKRKHDEETLAQYLKEQELFNQKSLVSKQSKEKLSLNFMYEAPPGFKKPEAQKGEQAKEKLEWKGKDGEGSSKGIGSQLVAIKSETKEPSSSICLEWKRERPVTGKNKAKGDDKSMKEETNSIKIKEERDTKRIKKEH